MKVTRSRIIVEYKDLDFLSLLKNENNADVVYKGNDDNKCLILYCDRDDEKFLLETLINDKSVIDAKVSNERVDYYNF